MTDEAAISPLGLCLRPSYGGVYSIDAMRAHAVLADSLGYHSVWLAESWGQDAIPVLADVAASTRQITVGTAVLNVFSRSPSLLAMTAVTMSELYPRRFILGLGTGTKALIEGWHGIPFDRPVSRLTDALRVVRAVTSGQAVDYHGATVTVSGYRLRVPAGQPPGQVYVAALGQRGLALAAREADGWLPYLMSRAALPERVARIRQLAAGGGRGDGGPAIAPLIVTCVDEDAGVAREQARRHIASYLGAMGPHYREFVAGNGYGDQVAAIAGAWHGGDRAAATRAVTDAMVEDIAVSGTPADCARQLGAWRAAGADLPILHFPSGTTAAGVELAIRGLASGTRVSSLAAS
jgi:probable F420-dependent oxidoreductase